jgi:hypothetical protein
MVVLGARPAPFSTLRRDMGETRFVTTGYGTSLAVLAGEGCMQFAVIQKYSFAFSEGENLTRGATVNNDQQDRH